MGADRRGFALLAVLWALVVAAAVVAEAGRGVRADQRAAANARAAARARWAARGGLARAEEALRAALSGEPGSRPLARVGEALLPTLEYEVDGVGVAVEVRDARARLPLNLAPVRELAAAFAAAGLPREEAAALAGRVDAWRRARPAPPADSTRGGVPRGSFEAVEALLRVPGVSPEAYARVAPLLSAAGDGWVNLNSAPPAVLAALPGLDAEGAAAIAARRRVEPLGNLYEVLALLPRAARLRAEARLEELAARAAFSARPVEVRVQASVPGSPVRATLRAAVVAEGRGGVRVERVVER